MAKRLVYELKKIKKDYNNTTVLNVKHLQCHPGTIYGIIGPIGSGKTTLLKILGGRLKPTTGELIFDGEEFKTNWRGKIIPFEDIWYGSLEELDDKNRISAIHYNLAYSYTIKEDYARALEAYDISAKISEELGDKNMVGYIMKDMGSLYYKKMDLDNAFNYFSKNYLHKI